MCICVYGEYDKVDTRLEMGFRYYHDFDESWGDGKVDTSPGVGIVIRTSLGPPSRWTMPVYRTGYRDYSDM
jgi:hypothetical protein